MYALRLTMSLLFSLLVFNSTLSAHELTPAVVDIQQLASGQAQVSISLNLESHLADITADHDDTTESKNAAIYDEYRNYTPEQLSLAAEPWLDALTARIRLGETALQLQSLDIPDIGDTRIARYTRVQLITAEPLTGAWQFNWQQNNTDVALRVSSIEIEDLYTAYLSPSENSVDVDFANLQAQTRLSVFTQYIWVGFEHIIPLGLDHILFVIGLFLFSARLGPLLWQVSAFTLAHTITLALAMLGYISLPASIVEPLIAASIVYVAVENFFVKKLHWWRPALIFGFGLLHGLGFASVLTDFGISANAFAAALIGFNIGVELGQLSVIILALLTVGWFRNQAFYRPYIVQPGSLLIAAVGAYWFVERVFF